LVAPVHKCHQFRPKAVINPRRPLAFFHQEGSSNDPGRKDGQYHGIPPLIPRRQHKPFGRQGQICSSSGLPSLQEALPPTRQPLTQPPHQVRCRDHGHRNNDPWRKWNRRSGNRPSCVWPKIALGSRLQLVHSSLAYKFIPWHVRHGSPPLGMTCILRTHSPPSHGTGVVTAPFRDPCGFPSTHSAPRSKGCLPRRAS